VAENEKSIKVLSELPKKFDSLEDKLNDIMKILLPNEESTANTSDMESAEIIGNIDQYEELMKNIDSKSFIE